MRVLVLGARGMLGTDLIEEWKKTAPADELISAGSAEADIRDESQVDGLVRRTKPDWAVVCAAYTDVDGCEKNRELAFQVNSSGVEYVARWRRRSVRASFW